MVKGFINTHNKEVMRALGQETSQYILRNNIINKRSLFDRHYETKNEILERRFFIKYSGSEDANLEKALTKYKTFVNKIKDIMIDSDKLIAKEQMNNPGIHISSAYTQLNKISSNNKK